MRQARLRNGIAGGAGALIAIEVRHHLHLPFWAGFMIALAVAIIVGLLVQRLLRRKHS